MRLKWLKLNRLRKLHGQFHEWIIKCDIKYARSLIFPLGRKIYVIGTPLYSNLGDSAITIAQKQLLCDCGYTRKSIVEVTQSEYWMHRNVIRKLVERNALVCLVGGGNMGDEWFLEEKFRRQVIRDFPKNKIVIFPQTIHYSDSEKGVQEKENSVKIYNRHNQLTLVAREKKSFEVMKQLYPENQILFTPDIVLYLEGEALGIKEQKREGIMLCLRDDAERNITDEEKNKIVEVIKQKDYKYRVTDMYAEGPVTKENRKNLVIKKMKEFASAELVITDRLHGMVFSVITGTPCIVMSNYNHKVSGTYDWIKFLGYVRWADTVDEAINNIECMQKVGSMKYTSVVFASYYDEIKKIIMNKE